MAIDETLVETADLPSIRFYQWDHKAISFGYFGKIAKVENLNGGRDLVRRWTGGGIVFHGEDLTYALVIPASDPAFSKSSLWIYEEIHCAIADALTINGERAELATEKNVNVQRLTFNDQCFANPVRADVLVNGRKIAGAAQRRTRRGFLQQGSIQQVRLTNDFPERLAGQLGQDLRPNEIEDVILRRAEELVEQKYGTEAWMRRR